MEFELSVAIDPTWLRAPERVFPITLDPTVGFLKDCYIANAGLADTNLCTHDHLDVGYNGTDKKRALNTCRHPRVPQRVAHAAADVDFVHRKTPTRRMRGR